MNRWRWHFITLALLLALFFANHFEHSLRAKKAVRTAEQSVPVMQIIDSNSGHSSIQIDEQIPLNGYLHFSTLGTWEFDQDNPAPAPALVMEAHEQKIKMTGFMYPLQESDNLTLFALLRTTQTCCYGPRPQYNQYVFVEMSHPVKFERLAPVVVEGRFLVDAKPEDGYIYRLEGDSVRHAAPDDQPVSAEAFALKNDLPRFDFAPLLAARTAADKEEAINRLAVEFDGRQMVLAGFISGKTGAQPLQIMIGEYPWDGKSQGTPPNLYNTVLVSPKSGRDTPPVWWQEAVFKGRLQVTKDPAARGRNGIISLQDAELAVSGSGSSALSGTTAPLLPPVYELIIIAIWACFFFIRLRAHRSLIANAQGDKKCP